MLINLIIDRNEHRLTGYASSSGPLLMARHLLPSIGRRLLQVLILIEKLKEKPLQILQLQVPLVYDEQPFQLQ